MKFGSLFSGIGGIDLGLERAGMKCAWQVENNEFCTKVLNKHWPDVPKFGDIKDVGRENLETVDLIAGGFPCQPFSVAGKRKGTEDDRHLWPEMLRVISELKPTWVIGENVPGIIPIFLDQAISDLEAEGYTCEAYVLPACGFDASHKRDRLFIIANYAQRRLNGKDVPERSRRSNKATIDISGSCENVENPRCSHGKGAKNQSKHQESHRSRNAVHNKRPSSTSGLISDTNSKGQSLKRPIGGGKEYASIESHGNGRARWLPEPRVGRVVTRISSALDGTIRRFGYENASDKEAIAEIDKFRGEILRRMWEEKHQAKQTPYREERDSGENSMYEMSCLRTHERWNMGQRIEKEEELRDLRKRIYAKPLEETQELQQELLERIREKERNEKVESSRVNRLKGLGNAVVPQVAEHIGRMIMECNSLHR